VGQDSQKELQDLSSVHDLYLGLLERDLGHAVPIPAAIKTAAEDRQTTDNTKERLETLRHWLDVLDLATTPPLVRDALKASGLEGAHSLLRYFVGKRSVRAGDRDKTDCVVTHLYRSPSAAATPWHRPEIDSSYLAISQAALAFEAELYRALGDVQVPSMPPEHVQLLQEFEYLYQELEEFRHFDQVMDSGIVQRVRELKQSLGRSFYHPDSLANLAAWNDIFGRKFDLLFHDATKQIKTFAEHVQKGGGSILSRVEGDITVQHLSEIETGEILGGEYQHSQDEFRKVSRYQKAVENKRTARPLAPLPPPPAEAPKPAPVTQAAPAAPSRPRATAAAPGRPEGASPRPLQTEVLAVPPSEAVQNAVQEGKIHSARLQIKELVRNASDPRIAHIISIKKTKLALSAAEVEAFRADYEGEKSFRANYAALMMTLVAYLSRMIVEVDEYNQKAGSAYLWKPHADALSYLVATLERLSLEASQLMVVARTRGLADKAGALEASLDKLKDYAKTVSQTLRTAEQSSGS
jgi:hypothetical protein